MEIRPLSTRLIKPNFYVSPSYRRSTKRSLETGNIFKTTKSPVSQSRNRVCAKEKHETNELTGVRFPIAKLTSRALQSRQTAFANAYELILLKKFWMEVLLITSLRNSVLSLKYRKSHDTRSRMPYCPPILCASCKKYTFENLS